MFFSYLILSLCAIVYCNQDDKWLKCKPKPGCSIAQCDPRPPGRWFGDEGIDNDYPILCQQSEASSSTSAVTELVNKFDEIQIDIVKIVGRLERSEKVELEINFDITLLEKKNAETKRGLRSEMDRVKKEVEESKTRLNGAMKQIEETNNEMRSEMDSVKKETEEDKRKWNGAMKHIALLEKKKVEMERKINRLKIEVDGSKGKMNDAMIQIDFLNKKNAKLEKDVEESKGKTEDLIKILCPLISQNACFIAVIGRKVNYDDGVDVCKSLGGYLANIYSQAHMDEVMKYIRENRMDGSNWQNVRLGMKYDPKAKKLILHHGSNALAGLKWFPHYPLTIEDNAVHADYTNVILRVNSDQSSIYKHLVNSRPSNIITFFAKLSEPELFDYTTSINY